MPAASLCPVDRQPTGLGSLGPYWWLPRPGSSPALVLGEIMSLLYLCVRDGES